MGILANLDIFEVTFGTMSREMDWSFVSRNWELRECGRLLFLGDESGLQ